jgi:hypothetical protein
LGENATEPAKGRDFYAVELMKCTRAPKLISDLLEIENKIDPDVLGDVEWDESAGIC